MGSFDPLFFKGVISATEQTQKYLLTRNAWQNNSLALFEKKAVCFLQRLWIWLGFDSASIVKISEFFQETIGIGRQDFNAKVESLTSSRSIEELRNLSENLINFNRKVESHNRSLSWWSLRGTAKKVDGAFIHAVLLKIPHVAVNEQRVLASLDNRSLFRRMRDRYNDWYNSYERLVVIEGFSAKHYQAPFKLPHHGNTCHFASAVNFLASLPFAVNAFSTNAVDSFIGHMSMALCNQIAGLQVSDNEYSRLLEKSRGGILKNQNPHRQEDASEDIKHFLEECDPQQKNSKILTSTVQTRTYSNYQVVGQVQTGNPAHVKDIAITEEELLAGKEFSFLGDTESEHVRRLSVVDVNGKPLKTFYEVVEENFKACHQSDAISNPIVRPAGSLNCYHVRGNAFITPKLKNAPEALMLQYGCLADNGQRLRHDIRTPIDVCLPGRYFVDGKSRNYKLMSTVHHRGGASSGHFTALQNRGGKWFHNDDLGPEVASEVADPSQLINSSYILGYALVE